MPQSQTDFLETYERTFEITTPIGVREEQIILHLQHSSAWTCDIELGMDISAKIKALRIEARKPEESQVNWLVAVVFLLRLRAWELIVSDYHNAQDTLSHVNIWPVLPHTWACLGSE